LAVKEKLPVINERIRAEKVQVINREGQNVGILLKRDALRLAEESHLDLVLISETGNEGFPVAKIMDFGKVVYSKKKKATEAKKKQKVIKVKEIKIRPKIGDHDLQTKIKQVGQFLEEGKRVKMTLVFKGREVGNKNELGSILFEKIDSALSEFGLKSLSTESDLKLGQFWSRVYYLKT